MCLCLIQMEKVVVQQENNHWHHFTNLWSFFSTSCFKPYVLRIFTCSKICQPLKNKLLLNCIQSCDC